MSKNLEINLTFKPRIQKANRGRKAPRGLSIWEDKLEKN